MFQRVLIPIDGSAASLQAVDIVKHFNSPQGRVNVTVAVVISPLSAEQGDFRTDFIEQHNAWLRIEAQQVADRAIESLRAQGMNCAAKVLKGKPVSAILAREAVDGHYDLIVMGSRGLGRQEDRLNYLGNVTEHVIRRVAIPVLVVPVEEADNDD